VSSNPLLLDSVQVAGDNDWYTTGQPAGRRWVFNNNNHNLFFNCDSVPCSQTFFLSPDGPDGVTIAPTGNRFLWLPADDAVVYDSRTFDTAYVVPGFHNVHGTFSPDGDTLVLAADVYIPPSPSLHIVAVRASDGAVLHDLSLDSLLQSMGYQTLSPIAFDRERPLLYATVSRYSFADSLSHLRLIVLDRRTWTIVGMAEGVGGWGGSVAIVPSPVEHLVYVVGAVQGYNMHGYRAFIWRFGTP